MDYNKFILLLILSTLNLVTYENKYNLTDIISTWGGDPSLVSWPGLELYNIYLSIIYIL